MAGGSPKPPAAQHRYDRHAPGSMSAGVRKRSVSQLSYSPDIHSARGHHLRLVAERPVHAINNPSLVKALADLDRLTDWESRPRAMSRSNLDPVHDLSERLGYPELHFRSVHVTGTKGKSSVARLVEAGLKAAGLRVGRYSSPHVSHISERISLNGEPVSEEAMAEAIGRAIDAFEMARGAGTAGRNATWFDLLTMAAFDLFRRAGIEWAVVEAGLGGRVDSTNIVDSDVAIITNVELEHTEILGATRQRIAIEKSGIIKPGSFVVTPLCEMDEAGAAIAVKARDMGATLIVPAIPGNATIAEGNAIVAGAAFDALGERGVWEKVNAPYHRRLGNWLADNLPTDAGRLPGRMERMSVIEGEGRAARRVPVVLDGAHVPFNLRAVLADLARDATLAGPFIVVVSMGSDKDARGLLETFMGRDVALVLTRATGRSYEPAMLGEIAASLGLKHEVEADPLVAYKSALRAAARDGRWVLVTGSLYLAGLVPR